MSDAVIEKTKHPLLYKAVSELYATTGESKTYEPENWTPGPRITADPALEGVPYTADELARAEAVLATLTDEERHMFAVGDEEDARLFEARGDDFKLASDILVSCFAEQ